MLRVLLPQYATACCRVSTHHSAGDSTANSSTDAYQQALESQIHLLSSSHGELLTLLPYQQEVRTSSHIAPQEHFRYHHTAIQCICTPYVAALCNLHKLSTAQHQLCVSVLWYVGAMILIIM